MGQPAINLPQSVKLAGIIVALAVLYFLARGLFAGSANGVADSAPQGRFVVIANMISPEEWHAEVVIRGRTKAERKVVVRAETAGVIAETPAELGAMIRDGDVLCRINIDARQALLAEARAALAKARLDYDAAVKLNAEGFRSQTAVAASRAARDQAAAQVERARIELAQTEIIAPFDGVFDHRNVEVGDFVKIGDPCGTVIQASPFLVIGAVSEREVGKIEKGDKGVARLATGETISGVVRFVGASADPATRTFNVELEIPNENGKLRDGVTSDFTVFAKKREAYHLARSALVLNDSGAIGVRTLSPENEVHFAPVMLLGEDNTGIWVAGPDGDQRVITRGQAFVSAGQKVDVADEKISAGVDQ